MPNEEKEQTNGGFSDVPALMRKYNGNILKANPTPDFFEMYMYSCGHSETPAEFHLWACISLLGAVLGRAVYFVRYRESPTFPNLYVGLVADSGIGKGNAISRAVQFYDGAFSIKTPGEEDVWTIPKYIRGGCTEKALVDQLKAHESYNDPAIGNMGWLVHDELRNDIPSYQAQSFGATLTELKTAGHYDYTDRTRKHGPVSVDKPCLSWLFGSTPTWLTQTFEESTLVEGLGARIMFVVPQHHDRQMRKFKVEYPKDVEAVEQALVEYLKTIRNFAVNLRKKGKVPLGISKEADEALTQFHEDRENTPFPFDRRQEPTWRRRTEQVLQLCIIFAMAGLSPKISINHFLAALSMYRRVENNIMLILKSIVQTWEARIFQALQDVFEENSCLTRSQLTRAMHDRGGRFTVKQWKPCLDTLIESRWVEVQVRNGVTYYVWVPSKRSLE